MILLHSSMQTCLGLGWMQLLLLFDLTPWECGIQTRNTAVGWTTWPPPAQLWNCSSKVQVSKEAVCDTLLVCVMPAFKLYETSFNNFVRYRNCPRWTKAFYIDVCVIKDFWCYCRVVCNHPAISCSIWCHSYIRTTILQLVYSGTVVRQADWI